MTIFNPDLLKTGAVSGSFSTSLPPMPEGEYPFTVTGVEVKNPKADVVIAEYSCETYDDAVCTATGMTPSRTRYACFLDLDEVGMLAVGEGKNVGLGKLREAVGQNDDDTPWTMEMPVGQSFLGLVRQRVDDKDATRIYAEIKQLSPM